MISITKKQMIKARPKLGLVGCFDRPLSEIREIIGKNTVEFYKIRLKELTGFDYGNQGKVTTVKCYQDNDKYFVEHIHNLAYSNNTSSNDTVYETIIYRTKKN